MVPVSRETRAPYTTRLNTERPYSSVPNQCSAEGGCRRLRRFCRSGGTSAMTGAKTATRMRTAMRMRPTMAMRLRKKRRTAGEPSRPADFSGMMWVSAIADPRVQQGVGQIDEQVHDDEHHRDEQHGALHEQAVLRADGINHEPA